ncbi:DgyrCDS7678 [Dimorphilus gyrociliatus]|uniref:Translation initiation factor eIF2B subunit delta n=1 Tax=Dimorphilus gyrociliatus TaxID=2664684 RepID=A0A7I8VRS6_9ANNE|nr:DgyrCDS7678 [Dimorphilus gyrociliatus]
MSESNKPPNTAKDSNMKNKTGNENSKLNDGKKDNTETAQKSKKQLKEERRALQEKQRKLKAEKQAAEQNKKDNQQKKQEEPTEVKSDKRAQQKEAKRLEKQRVPQRKSFQRKVGLFSHLNQFERENTLTETISFASHTIHPAVIRLGVQYAQGVICGSNARCIALLSVLKKLINDYSTPLHKELNRDFDAMLKPQISFLKQSRPMGVSMGNAIRYFKYNLNNIKSSEPDDKAKETLRKCIDDFIKEKIILADEAISDTAADKIKNGDVILTYGASSLILKVLCKAHERKIQFRVIVVDGRPRMEGKEMLRKLLKEGIECSYSLINATAYAMKEVTKVFLGAHGLLANGYVMCRIGSGQVALAAKVYNVPVLVCCETYKFCDRVQTDSFVFNELDDPSDLVENGLLVKPLENWKTMENLYLLNILYDVTPPDLVSLVITEIGMLPCTSVPVVLRVHNTALTTGFE